MTVFDVFYQRPLRNQPVRLKPLNPQPESAQRSDCGDAGVDGYTVLSRASDNGVRPPIGGEPVYQGPRFHEEE
jgi:hypothetical protein